MPFTHKCHRRRWVQTDPLRTNLLERMVWMNRRTCVRACPTRAKHGRNQACVQEIALMTQVPPERSANESCFCNDGASGLSFLMHEGTWFEAWE